VKLNRTGMNQMRRESGASLAGDYSNRLTTTQTQVTGGSRATIKQGGRTRAQIIAEFFCSQNWNYLARKALMVKHEREQTRV